MILPTDFGLPAAPYIAALTVGAVAAIVALYYRRPPVTAASMTALAPWMAAGGTLYALYQAGIPPESVAPFFSSPAVYLSVGILAGFVFAGVANRPGETWNPTDAPTILVASGGLLLAVALVSAGVGMSPDTNGFGPVGSAAILLTSIVLAAVVWTGLKQIRNVDATGTVGGLAIFAHTLDGISTAVGYDLLGVDEQTPLSRIILETGGALPTAELVGAGWLFALVKIVLGAAIVLLFEGYVRDDPTEGYLLLGLIVAIGLGPGLHNLVLFAIV